ncbi:UBX domain protein Ubx2 [Coemansia spiralis]|nr:UBX domain protein Ubx2 [Coemansia spiralis]
MDSESIQSFCAVTGAEAHVASEYLQVTDRNVEQAISLYFENGGLALQSQAAAGAEPAAVAAEADEVRAPIAARRDVLVDDYGGVDYSAAGYVRPTLGRMREAASIFAQQPGAGRVPFRDFAQEAAEMTENARNSASGGSESAASRRSRLADLFKPPFDLMHAGGLESARTEGTRNGRWVLVNLQQVSEFQCQALNRDVWSQEGVRDIVKRNFIFLQLPTDNSEGSRVANMYGAEAFPFIAAIHPKTGELRARFARFTSPVDVIEDLANFVLDNLLPGPRNAAAAAPGASTSAASTVASVYNLTEEEQLAAAIAASELGGPAIVDSDEEINSSDGAESYSDIHTIDSDTDGDVYSDQEDEMDVDDASLAHEQMAAEAAVDVGPDAWYTQLPDSEPPEPSAGPGTTRVQLRFPSGQRVVRQFALADRVAAVFQFLKATLPGAADGVPEVLFLGTRLADRVDQTIEQAGLANASLVVDV